MIDVLLRDPEGLFVVHDERELDQFSAIVFNPRTKLLALQDENNSRHPVGVLAPALAEGVNAKTPGRIIRMNGYAIARVANVPVTLC
jgi:hypothetical protein